MATENARPVRIGVQIAQQHCDYAVLRAAATEAEDIGVDIIFNWDHFFPLTGDTSGKHFECWTMLAAWAEQTSRVELGPLVSANTFRNPDLLADMARTVDHISGGRLILGMGSGWSDLDYAEYGYDYGTPGSRLDDLALALPRMEQRFAKLNPAPVRKIPVLIGGAGEKKTLPMVARHADIWHSFTGGTEFARKKRILAEQCERIGREPGEIEAAVGVGGDPAETGDALLELGATTFTLEIHGPDFDFAPVRAWVAWRDKRRD